ncbi:major facilitator superfamily domain-containing protein 4A-like isoform X1 [Argiope bruennichi]|uniref:Major facilitator superfamily domain-containing protein 4A n=1 Tax=Argiope bruennichi TaxID=94029 RepID=A0A8T0FI41_ARGBR|nr:major facilitator superfamily domain-containing protein 4A-like isoform X1 [Argiope bruennichi]KAF8790671.1 Major facilitator superfamily like protein [Argiope bruennichi]
MSQPLESNYQSESYPPQSGNAENEQKGPAPEEGGPQPEIGGVLNMLPAGALIQTKKEHFYHLLWTNKHVTGTLCAVFWSFGMCVAFLGPTLLDLGCKTNTVFATMSWVFFSQSLFVLLGSACGGFLVQRINPYILLVVSIIMMGITMAIIPFCEALWILTLVLAVMGFFMGTIDTVANVSMIRIYGKDVSPFLQALHFFYGAGAFISPMIAQPFLLSEDCSPFIDNTSVPVHILEQNETLPAKNLEEAKKMTHIDNVFFIMAALMIPVALLSLTLLGKDVYLRMIGKGDVNQNKQADLPPEPFEEKYDTSPVSKFQTIVITLLCASLMFLYDGLQAVYGGYLYSYAVKGPVSLRKSNAAYLNALFWGMFAMGRLLSIVLATRLAPAFMLGCNIVGCTLGMLFMLAFSHSKGVLVFGTIIIGLFMSSVFPTTLSLTEEYIKVTPTITSFLVFGAAFGEMFMPVILGHEFDRTGPITFLVTGVVLCFLSLIIYMALWIVGHTIVRSTGGGLFGFASHRFPAADGEDTSLTTQHVRYYSRMRSETSQNSLGDQQYAESSFTEQSNSQRQQQQ